MPAPTPTPPRRWPDSMIAAAAANGVPPRRLRELMDTYPDPAHAAASLPAPPRHPGTEIPTDGFVLVHGDPDYPSALAAAPNPPRILYGRGNRTLLVANPVAVTGTRAPTRYGLAVATAAASAVAYATAPLVSGAAAGVDRAAALAATQYGTPNILVLATGPDQVTDPTQAELVTDALTYQGLVLSEHPFGTGTDTAPGYQPAPFRARLAARNRIITGLSTLTIVVAGTLRSGTAGATWTALAAGRPVVVAQPRDNARTLTDTELPQALAHAATATVAQLTAAGCPPRLARTLTDRAPLANAVAGSPEELTDIVTTLHLLSPHTRAPHLADTEPPTPAATTPAAATLSR